MTALERFIRLEALGSWRQTPQAEPREVVVSFGNATLILRDMHDAPLGHWALNATHVIASTETGTTYATTDDADETLVIADFEMIRAIAAISAHKSPRLQRRSPPGWFYAALAVSLVAVVLWSGPDLLRRYTATAIPGAQSERIGAAMLTEIVALQGRICQNPTALPAVEKLLQRLFPGDASWRLHVLPMNARPSASLPGGHVLLNKAVLDALIEPDELAGYIALEAARASAGAPLTTLLRDASLGVSLGLLLRGQLDAAVSRQTSQRILAGTGLPETRYDAAALAILAAARIDTRPFAWALARSGADDARASGFDLPPPAGASAALADQDWVALQDICAG